jgi:hypothetical protein
MPIYPILNGAPAGVVLSIMHVVVLPSRSVTFTVNNDVAIVSSSLIELVAGRLVIVGG